MPMLMIPPAPPCMLYVDMGALGTSQYWLKMPLSSDSQISWAVQGQPLGALKGFKEWSNLESSKSQGRQRGASGLGWDARPGLEAHHM